MIAQLLCQLAALTMQPYAGGATLECNTPDEVTAIFGPESHVAGWYSAHSNTAHAVTGMSLEYTQQVFAHEIAHAADRELGTMSNGYGSYFSETHTGFDIEEYARMLTYVSGWWPTDEAFPDPIPAAEDIERMRAAGWLPERYLK